jgi:colanic acid biosynthesis protein WcaH
MFLEKKIFNDIIKSTPLVSLDIIIRDEDHILLGKRLNEPAKEYWFVPGGRILKGESLAVAYRRIISAEVGVDSELASAQFLGVYEHFYTNNVFNDEFDTHYVVLAYVFSIKRGKLTPSKCTQHSEYYWFGINELLCHEKVHQNTKNYFTI